MHHLPLSAIVYAATALHLSSMTGKTYFLSYLHKFILYFNAFIRICYINYAIYLFTMFHNFIYYLFNYMFISIILNSSLC